jgi:raffinose/stachyose/melibiose transport system permease protein
MNMKIPRSMRRIRPSVVTRHLGLILMSVVTLAPMAWIAFLSFKSRRGFAENPFGLPESWNLDNYIKILTDERMLHFAMNSVVVTTTAVLIILVTCILAGYALARIEFKGSRFLFVLFILSDAVPIFVVLIPLFILIDRLGLADTRWSIIFPYTAMHIGVSVFIFRGFFRTISSEMEDAARIDGCSTLQILWYIMLPLIRPAVLVVLIVDFISIWNEYFLAVVILPSQDLFTLPAGLATVFTSKYAADWPAIATGIVLSVLPVFVIFIMAQDRIIEGWTMSHK